MCFSLAKNLRLPRSSEYAAVKEAFDEKHARQAAVLKQLQPSVLIESLAEAAGAADRDSDEVAPLDTLPCICRTSQSAQRAAHAGARAGRCPI